MARAGLTDKRPHARHRNPTTRLVPRRDQIDEQQRMRIAIKEEDTVVDNTDPAVLLTPMRQLLGEVRVKERS